MEILVITPYTLKIKDNGTCFDASIVKDSLTFQYSTFKVLGKLNCEFHDLLAWYDSNGEYNTRLIIEYEYKDEVTTIKCLPTIELFNYDILNYDTYYYGYKTTVPDGGIEECLRRIINNCIVKGSVSGFNNDSLSTVEQSRITISLLTATKENMNVVFGVAVNPCEVFKEVASMFNILIEVKLTFYQDGQFNYLIKIGKNNATKEINSSYMVELKKSEDKNYKTNLLMLYPEDTDVTDAKLKPIIYMVLLKNGQVFTFDEGVLVGGTVIEIDDIPIAQRITPVIKKFMTYDNTQFDNERDLKNTILAQAMSEFRQTIESTSFSFSMPSGQDKLKLGDKITFNYEEVSYSCVITQVNEYIQKDDISLSSNILYKYKCGISRTSLTDKLNSQNGNSNIKNVSSVSGGIAEEIDPTVPSWAKQPNKPTYTASEVGAYSKSEVDNKVSEITEDLTAVEERGLTNSSNITNLDNTKLDVLYGGNGNKAEGLYFGWDYQGLGTSDGPEFYFKGKRTVAFTSNRTYFENEDGLFNTHDGQMYEILDDGMFLLKDEIEDILDEILITSSTTITSQATLFLSNHSVQKNLLSRTGDDVTFTFEATFNDASSIGSGIIQIPDNFKPSKVVTVNCVWYLINTAKTYTGSTEISTSGQMHITTSCIPVNEIFGAQAKLTINATWTTTS